MVLGLCTSPKHACNAWRAQKSGLQLFCALFPPDYPYDPAEPALVRLVLERRCLDADSTPSWQPTYAHLSNVYSLAQATRRTISGCYIINNSTQQHVLSQKSDIWWGEGRRYCESVAVLDKNTSQLYNYQTVHMVGAGSYQLHATITVTW